MTEAASVSSVLPGTLVNALITAVVPAGLNVRLLGYFDGTVDQFHLGPGDPTTRYKPGDKVGSQIWGLCLMLNRPTGQTPGSMGYRSIFSTSLCSIIFATYFVIVGACCWTVRTIA